MMQKTIQDISLRNEDLCCIPCMFEGHTKDTFWHREDRKQEVRPIQTKYYYEINQEIMPHHTKDCPYNLKNSEAK